MPLRDLIKHNYNRKLVPAVSRKPLSNEARAFLWDELGQSKFTLEESGQTYLENCKAYVCFSSLHFNIHVVATSPREFPPHPLMFRILRRLECLHTAFKMRDDKFEYWLVPHPSLRHFPRFASQPIRPKHINGAYTYTTESVVIVFRAEEFPKVMLHELIHHLPLDTYDEWPSDVLRSLAEAFGIGSTFPLNPNEAVVEAWAELFHLSFIAYEYNWDFADLLETECGWAKQQTARILKKQKTMGEWSETTQAYSYIVFRTIFLMHPGKFMECSGRIAALAKMLVDGQKIVATFSAPPHDSLRMTVFGDL